MRPYETMLRRYRETARGLLGCYPAASTVILATPRISPPLSRSLSLSLSPIGNMRLSTLPWRYRYDGVLVTKNNAWWHDENCEKRRRSSTMFFFFSVFSTPPPPSQPTRRSTMLARTQKLFRTYGKIRVEMFLTVSELRFKVLLFSPL